MVISFPDGIKIKKLKNSTRKALRERLDPTSESSTRIAGSSGPSVCPTPMALGDSIPNSVKDGVLQGGSRSRKISEETSDDERNLRKI